MPLIEIAKFHNPVEAQMARAALETAGINAVLFDHGIASAYAGALGLAQTRLMVPQDEERAARAFLEAAA